MSGNVGTLALPFVVDNTAPTVAPPRRAPRRATSAPAPRVQISVRDAGPGAGYALVHRESGGALVFPSRHARAARRSSAGLRDPSTCVALASSACRPSTRRATRRAPSPCGCARDELERPARDASGARSRAACARPPSCSTSRFVNGLAACRSLHAAGAPRDRRRPPPEGARPALALGDRRALARSGGRGGVRRVPRRPGREHLRRAGRRLPDPRRAARGARRATPSGWPPTRFRASGWDVVGPLQHKRHQYEAAARAGVATPRHRLPGRPRRGRARRRPSSATRRSSSRPTRSRSSAASAGPCSSARTRRSCSRPSMPPRAASRCCRRSCRATTRACGRSAPTPNADGRRARHLLRAQAAADAARLRHLPRGRGALARRRRRAGARAARRARLPRHRADRVPAGRATTARCG